MKTADLTGAELDYWVAKAEGEDPEEVRSLQYSKSWRDAGKIIERERIAVVPYVGRWAARKIDLSGTEHFGPTPLIAAMRAYVAAKFGPDVDAKA